MPDIHLPNNIILNSQVDQEYSSSVKIGKFLLLLRSPSNPPAHLVSVGLHKRVEAEGWKGQITNNQPFYLPERERFFVKENSEAFNDNNSALRERIRVEKEFGGIQWRRHSPTIVWLNLLFNRKQTTKLKQSRPGRAKTSPIYLSVNFWLRCSEINPVTGEGRVRDGFCIISYKIWANDY